MAGTIAGGKKTSQIVTEKYGSDYFAKIGSTGGKNGTTGGFYADKDRAKKAGKLGGQRSFRGYKLLRKKNDIYTYENTKTGELMTVNYGSPFKTLKKVLTKIL